MSQRLMKFLVSVLIVSIIALVGIGVFWSHLALAQTGDEPTTQASPEATPGVDSETLHSLSPDFDWDAYTEYEARLTKCEMVDAIKWLPENITKIVQIQRCIGPSPFIFLESPDLESLPPAENVPQPPTIQPKTIEAAPNQ